MPFLKKKNTLSALENGQKSGFYIVKFPKLQREDLPWVPRFLTQKISECLLYMYSKSMEMFSLNSKAIFKLTNKMMENCMI